MSEIERSLRRARPAWPEPSPEAEARARAALGLERARRVRRRPARGRGMRLLAAAGILVVAGGAVAVAVIGGTSGAHASAGAPASLAFLPAEPVASGFDQAYGLPEVGVDGRGAVTVVWGTGGRVLVRVRGRDGAWSPPVRLSTQGRRALSPKLVVGRGGQAVVVWRERIGGRRTTERFRLPSGAPAGALTATVALRWAVVARVRSPEGRWGPPERLSAPARSAGDLKHPQVAMGDDGTAIAAWSVRGGLWARVRLAGAGRWQSAVRLGPAGITSEPRLAAGPSGHALVAWSTRRVGAGQEYANQVRAAAWDPASGWEPAEPLGAPVPAFSLDPLPAVGSRGEALVTWMLAGPGPPRDARIAAAVRAPGDAWSDAILPVPRPIPPAPFRARPAVDGAGRMVLVGSAARVPLYERAPAGDWVRRSPSSPPARAVLVDASGRVLLARLSPDPPGLAIAPLGRPGAGVAAPLVLGGDYDIATGADGTLAVAGVADGWRLAVAVAPGGSP